jgi:hypothetical protein
MARSVWTNIEPQLIKWLEAKREERLERERIHRVIARSNVLKQAFNDYYIQHIGEISPTIADVFIMPDFYSILNSGVDVSVTEEILAPILAKLPEIVKKWRVENLAKLAQLVSAAVTPPPQNRKGKEKENYLSMLSVLDLATCFFKCANCIEPLWCERLFHHHCLTSPTVQIRCDVRDPEKDIYYNLGCVPHHYKRPFGGSEYSEEMAECAAVLVRMSGLDPKVATGKDMDATELRFACDSCSQGGDRRVMSWRIAVCCQCNHFKRFLF